jgi:hypothetical protein
MTLHSLAPFLLDMIDDPDMNQSDIDGALRADFARQRTLEKWLMGDLPFEAVLDLGADYGVDAYAYEDMICHNVEALIAQKTPIDDADRVLPDLWLLNTA